MGRQAIQASNTGKRFRTVVPTRSGQCPQSSMHRWRQAARQQRSSRWAPHHHWAAHITCTRPAKLLSRCCATATHPLFSTNLERPWSRAVDDHDSSAAFNVSMTEKGGGPPSHKKSPTPTSGALSKHSQGIQADIAAIRSAPAGVPGLVARAPAACLQTRGDETHKSCCQSLLKALAALATSNTPSVHDTTTKWAGASPWLLLWWRLLLACLLPCRGGPRTRNTAVVLHQKLARLRGCWRRQLAARGSTGWMVQQRAATTGSQMWLRITWPAVAGMHTAATAAADCTTQQHRAAAASGTRWRSG